MRKLRFNKLVLAMAIASTVFFSWACGGGSSGGGETPPSQPLTPASMDQTTAETVMAMGMSLDDISDISDSYMDNIQLAAIGGTQTPVPLAAWVMENVRAGFLSGDVINLGDASRAGMGSDNRNCEDSGTYAISGTWSGPDEPTDVCQISNATVTMTFSNCREYGDTVTGTITVRINGNLCTPTGISLSFRGFSMSDSYSGMEVNANSFDMAMSASQYSGDDPTHIKTTLDGDITVNSLSMNFSQFVEDVTISGSSQTISLGGSLSGDCLDGWVTFTTLSPVQANDYSDCPVGGSVQLSGDVDMVVTFYSDGSLTIDDQTYASCHDLPGTCQ